MGTVAELLSDQIARNLRKHVVGLSADTIRVIVTQAAKELPTPALEDVKQIIETELAERSGRALHG